MNSVPPWLAVRQTPPQPRPPSWPPLPPGAIQPENAKNPVMTIGTTGPRTRPVSRSPVRRRERDPILLGAYRYPSASQIGR